MSSKLQCVSYKNQTAIMHVLENKAEEALTLSFFNEITDAHSAAVLKCTKLKTIKRQSLLSRCPC